MIGLPGGQISARRACRAAAEVAEPNPRRHGSAVDVVDGGCGRIPPPDQAGWRTPVRGCRFAGESQSGTEFPKVRFGRACAVRDLQGTSIVTKAQWAGVSARVIRFLFSPAADYVFGRLIAFPSTPSRYRANVAFMCIPSMYTL